MRTESKDCDLQMDAQRHQNVVEVDEPPARTHDVRPLVELKVRVPTASQPIQRFVSVQVAIVAV